MSHLDSAACEPAPAADPSHSHYAEGFVDRLHQTVGELLTAHRRPGVDIEAIAVSLLAYLLLSTSSGPAPAYLAAIEKIARDRAAADPSDSEDPEAIYAGLLAGYAAGTIGELLAAARQTAGMHPMLVLADALNVYDDLTGRATD